MKTKKLIYSLTLFLLGSLMACSNSTSSKIENATDTLNKIDSVVKSSSWDDMDKEIDEDLKASAEELQKQYNESIAIKKKTAEVLEDIKRINEAYFKLTGKKLVVEGE